MTLGWGDTALPTARTAVAGLLAPSEYEDLHNATQQAA